MDETLIGALGALGSIFFFGTYAVFIRSPKVMAVNVDPLVFQTYKSFACFATSWLVLLYVPFRFTWWGMLGAFLWVITGVGAVTAVRLAGIGPTQSLWSALSIFVSYIWGAYVFKEPIKNQLMCLVALAIMGGGMIGVTWATSVGVNPFSQFMKLWKAAKMSERTGLAKGDEESESLNPKSTHEGLGRAKTDLEERYLKGVMVAVVVGITNGSFMIPLEYANKDVVGVEYIVSFGVGAAVMTPVILGIYSATLVYLGKPLPKFYFSVAAGPALLTGLFWSAGNYCSIYATLYLGMSLGWPLVQCQLIVSAMWAVFYYKEVTDSRKVAGFLGSSLVVVMGAAVLSKFGTHK